ncbi:MAG: DUF975 family protein [Candidatus Marinimicrobia bacterium]|nr:DUF975 family protein [Candidatus Neomarinimicrobiota bacterium]
MEFSKSYIIKSSWDIVKSNLSLLILAILLIFGINLSLGMIQDRLLEDLSFQSIVFSVAAYLFQMGLNLGVIRICLNLLFKKESGINQIFGSFHLLIPYLLSSIVFLFILAVVVSPGVIILLFSITGDINSLSSFESFSGPAFIFMLLLIVVPAVYVSIRLQYYDYFLVDEECHFFEAIQKSATITKGYVMELFLLGATIAIIILLSIIPLGAGLVISIPLAAMVNTFVYNLLKNAA